MSIPDHNMLILIGRIDWPSLSIAKVTKHLLTHTRAVAAAERLGVDMPRSRARLDELRMYLIPMEV